jgi:hypothetical protein
MNADFAAQFAAQFAQVLAAAVAAGRMLYLGLGKRFPALLGYLIFIACSSLCYSILDPRSKPFFWVYVFLMPLESIFKIFAVRELVMLTFDNYPGIRTVGRWTMYAGLVISITASLLLTRVFWTVGAHGRQKWGLFYFEVAQRSIVFALAVVIIAIIFVLSKYPLNLGRNTYVSCTFFSVLFLSEAAQLFVDAMMRELYNRYADWTEQFIIVFCLVGWAALLKPQTATAARVAFTGPQEDLLLQQLDSLNRLMSRAARQ